jgi:hypothetical protein
LQDKSPISDISSERVDHKVKKERRSSKATAPLQGVFPSNEQAIITEEQKVIIEAPEEEVSTKEDIKKEEKKEKKSRRRSTRIVRTTWRLYWRYNGKVDWRLYWRFYRNTVVDDHRLQYHNCNNVTCQQFFSILVLSQVIIFRIIMKRSNDNILQNWHLLSILKCQGI